MDLQLFADTEKTERATPRRRQEARKKGQVAKSMELGVAVSLLGVFLLLNAMGPPTGGALTQLMQQALSAWTREPHLNEGFLQEIALTSGLVFVRIALPVLGLALLLGVLSQIAQVGFMLVGVGLKPDLGRINPLQGLKRIFSRRALLELVKACFKILIIGYILYSTLRGQVAEFVSMIELNPVQAMEITWDRICGVGIRVGICLVVLAVADYFYQRFEYERSLRMSKEELKQELKETEGDPLIRSRIRQKQRQMAMNRMMELVPTADVVVTNPTHIAVALKYDPAAMSAPVVVAMGAGFIAEKIKEIAEKASVPVIENKPLARALFETAVIGQPIPVDLYKAVAEVLAVVYRLKNRQQ